MSRLLFEMYASAVSGALLLARDRVKKIVYLRSGYPVAIKSNLPAECLGKILLWDGRISHDQWRESLESMRQSGKRQGSILIEMGALSHQDLVRGLELQFRFRLGETFSWTDGRYQLWTGVRPPPELTTVDIAPATLIHEGIRSFMPPGKVLAELRSLGNLYLHPATNPLWRFQALVVGPPARSLLDRIDGTVRLSDLLRTTVLSVQDTCALVYALLCTRMVTPQREHRRSWASLRMPRLARDPLPSGPERTRHGDLARLVERLRRATPHEVLGVPPDAPLPVLRLAYQKRAAERHPDRCHASSAEGLRELAVRALDLTAGAFAALTPELQQDRSPETPETSEPQGPREEAPAEDLGSIAQGIASGGEDERSSLSEELRALLEMEDDLAPAEDDESLAGAELHPKAMIEEFSSNAIREPDQLDEPPEAIPDRTDEIPTPVEHLEEAGQDAGSKAPVEGGSFDDPLWQIIEAEQFHQQGLKLLDRGRFTEAAAALDRAVALCADVSEFRVTLAWATFQKGLDDEAATEALGHLDEAVSRSPSGRAYLFRGHILRFLERKDEAVWAYEEALRHDPESEEAKSELERIQESLRARS